MKDVVSGDRVALVSDLLATSRGEGRRTLSESDARKLLEIYGITCPSYRVATNHEEAAAAAVALGTPVVVKAMVPGLLHKTEEGAVAVDLASARDVLETCDAMEKRLGERIHGFIVEKMMPAGLDLLVGVVTDPVFGPVLSLGLGGTLVEFLQLVEFRLVPLTAADAHALVHDQRLGLTSKKLRSMRLNNPEELEAVILAVAGPEGLFVESAGLLTQFEINPMRVTRDGLIALDVKGVLK